MRNSLAAFRWLFLSAAALSAAGCTAAPMGFEIVAGGQAQPLRPGRSQPVVLIFITHDCPIANAYAPEIRRICQEYSPRGVEFFCVHADAHTSADAARRHAAEFALPCPVLLDPQRALARRVGATVTPEAAVILRDDLLAYRGRIDDLYVDWGKRRTTPTQRDLRDALDAVLAGRTAPHPRTTAVGCFIPD